MWPTDQFLFHCFPSRHDKLDSRQWNASDDNYLAAGLAILEFILSSGLLLTPEEIKIPRHPGAEQQDEKPIRFPQTRASFTLTSLDALQQSNPYYGNGLSHLAVFGEFSVGLDPLAARDFDMAPVSYFYFDPDRKAPDNSSALRFPLVASLVHSLVELREVVSILTRLEERAVVESGKSTPEYDFLRAQFDEARIGIQFQPEKRAEVLRELISVIPVQAIESVIGAINTDRRSLVDLVQAIDLLCGLLQTADSHSKKAKLAYFSQHEWRVSKVLNENVAGFSLVESDDRDDPRLTQWRSEVRESVRHIGDLLGKPVDEPWLRRTWVLAGTAHNEHPVRSYIKLITCPRECVTSVEKLVRDNYPLSPELPKVIAL